MSSLILSYLLGVESASFLASAFISINRKKQYIANKYSELQNWLRNVGIQKA